MVAGLALFLCDAALMLTVRMCVAGCRSLSLSLSLSVRCGSPWPAPIRRETWPGRVSTLLHRTPLLSFRRAVASAAIAATLGRRGTTVDRKTLDRSLWCVAWPGARRLSTSPHAAASPTQPYPPAPSGLSFFSILFFFLLRLFFGRQSQLKLKKKEYRPTNNEPFLRQTSPTRLTARPIDKNKIQKKTKKAAGTRRDAHRGHCALSLGKKRDQTNWTNRHFAP